MEDSKNKLLGAERRKKLEYLDYVDSIAFAIYDAISEILQEELDAGSYKLINDLYNKYRHINFFRHEYDNKEEDLLLMLEHFIRVIYQKEIK